MLITINCWLMANAPSAMDSDKNAENPGFEGEVSCIGCEGIRWVEGA